MKPSDWKPLFWWAVPAILWGLFGRCCAAAEFVEGFDGPQPSWTAQFDETQCRVLSHRRHAQIVRKGTGSENLELEVPGQIAPVRLEHKLPPSRVLDELTASVWVRSNRTGGALGVRVVLPHQKDAASGLMLTITLFSDETYSEAGSWQQLSCRTSDKKVAERLRLLRATLKADVDFREMYVDRAVFVVHAGRGTTELFLDELSLAPVVSPTNGTPILTVGEQREAEVPPVEIGERLLVGGRPYFPRMLPYHGESLDDLAATRCSPIWIPDHRDIDLIRALRDRGIWSMATPPQATAPSGGVLDAREASLSPFERDTDSVLFWYLGTGIRPADRAALTSWTEQLLGADHRRKRPVLADVAGLERIYSRLVPMLGVTRFPLQTSFDLKLYRNWLLERQKLTRPGTFLWTWIQTEPVEALQAARQSAGQTPAVVEPELIRLQTYAALAAGYRGVGFWTTTPLGSEGPGAAERVLMLRQLNLELELIGPWLATGTLPSQIPLTVTPSPTAAASQSSSKSPFPKSRTRTPQRATDGPQAQDLEAAVIRTDHGTLVLPVWYGRHTQFVPGAMTIQDASVVVPGVDHSAAVWEITTTDVHSRSLHKKHVTGGMQITLSKLDTTSMLFVSSDQGQIEKLRGRIKQMAAESAAISVELAELKLQRVTAVDQQLHELGGSLPDAVHILARARMLLEEARASRDAGDFHRARQFANDSCQMTRTLQRSEWDAAVKGLSDPVGSPHTLCYQTLPDHWRMIARLGRSPVSLDANLLRSGDFEDADALRAEGWQHAQHELEGVRATAELYPLPHRGNYCLRLAAAAEPGWEPPTFVPQPPVNVVTPPVTVRSGQLIHVSGWVKAVTPIVGSLDGVMLYDSLGGPEAAIRWTAGADWRRFELIREVQQSGELTITISLTGLGEIQFDDLRIIPLDPSSEPPPLRVAQPKPKDSRFGIPAGFNQLLPKLPGLGNRGRGADE